MSDDRTKALAEFRKVLVWVVVAAVAMVIGALFYLAATGEVTLVMVLATVFGAFVSVALGGGLMATIFFSDKSGYDQRITDATKQDKNADEV